MRQDAAGTRAAIEAALVRHGHNLSAIARETGVHRRTVQRHLQAMGVYGKKDELLVAADAPGPVAPAPRGGVRRTIITYALNDAPVNPAVWRNLLALREHWGAALLVRPGLYDTKDRAREWAEEVRPFLCDKRVELAPGLVFCGEMPISPTAVRPLSGLATYSGRASSIFAHPRVALESVPALRGEGAKFCYTTGAVTEPDGLSNSKAGHKARFHHVAGALLAEVDGAGRWWCRQLIAGDDGSIQDLDLVARDGLVAPGHFVEALVYEPHGVQAHPAAMAALPDMLDRLRPRYQVVHDLLDFRARNHHEEGDPHRAFAKFSSYEDVVEDEVRATADLLCRVALPYCETVVVASNHDAFLPRWLREADYRRDPTNAVFFLRAQLAMYEAIERGEDLHVVEWALRRVGAPAGVRFLREDESFRVAGGEVECGCHGHLGPDGARGNAGNLSRLARRMVIGHSHSAVILDGVYGIGTFSRLDLPYTRGPSSWSLTAGVVYPNSKRALVTLWDGKPWA